MKVFWKFGIVAAVLMLAIGCSTSSKLVASNLEEKVAKEPATPRAEDIADRGADVFVNAPDLTVEQKRKLVDIHVRVYAEVTQINEQIGKSKSLLFKTLVTKDYDSREIRDLKNRIVKLDKERLEIMFRALDDAQKIVGYGNAKDDFYRHYDERAPGREFPSVQ